MVEFIGLLKVKVIRGTNLAVRDMLSSDPYVVLTLGQQVSFCCLCLSFSICRVGGKETEMLNRSLTCGLQNKKCYLL